jgi:prepilin-type N-terminal cleavage/methylation domain-containing protein
MQGTFLMNRHVRKRFGYRRGFTLIEVLVATTLTLVMMAGVVQIFAVVGKSINNSRSTLEMSEQIRATVNRLRLDLEGVTADMAPSGRPEEGKGYFEYIEGPIGPVDPAFDPAATPGYNTDEGTIDSTVGDRDDILQFTTRSRGEPFVGRGLVICDPGTGEKSFGPFDRYTTVAKSQVAEVAWFLRGTTLYRRVLLVTPSFDADIRTPNSREAGVPLVISFRVHGNDNQQMGYYNNYDLSVHWDPIAGKIVCNTLADLTRRECRYAHPPLWSDGSPNAFPHALHLVGDWRYLGLPTLQECSHAAWPFPLNGRMPYRPDGSTAVNLTPSGLQFDAWVNPYTFVELDQNTGALKFEPPAVLPEDPHPVVPPLPLPADAPRYAGPREGEDVILTNVLSFDVKAWDPRALVLQAIDAKGTHAPPATNLGDDEAIANSAVVPGDPNYYIALMHRNAISATLSRGAYVDLGYCPIYPTTPPLSQFSEVGHYAQMRVTNALDTWATVPRIYDTWSIHYEHDGKDQDDGGSGPIDEGTDGFDNGGVPGVVDDPDEREAPPPYDVPLRGIQVKIRVFDPDSQKVREVTMRHDFLKK